MRSTIKMMIFFLVVTGAAEMKAQVSIKDKPNVVPGEVVVKFKNEVNIATAASSLQSLGLEEIKTSPRVSFVVGKVAPGKDVDQVLQALQSQTTVEYAEPNYYVYALPAPESDPVIPDDPRFDEMWNLQQNNDKDIDAPEAWAITTGSREVIVGIIDTGIDYKHPDLKENIWMNEGEKDEKSNNGIDDDGNGYVDDFRGWNFVFDNKDPDDDQSHGTHVAGTVGAVGNNDKGITGVSWQVQLMALKFLDGSGRGNTADAAEAIIYGTDNGAKILSNSWGGGGASQTLEDAIEYAHDNGVLFIAAAGNDGLSNDHVPTYPSNYEVPNVISVASTASNDKLSSFSNFGRRTVHIAAPGSNILSAKPFSAYQKLSGTSMATPHVSGVCALIWAKYPDLLPHQVMIRVLGSADYSPDLSTCVVAMGRLNAAKALSTEPLIAYTTDWSYTPDTTGYDISTSVVDDVGVTEVQLIYTLNDVDSTSVEMTSNGNDSYAARIPGQPQTTTISYAIQAVDTDGNGSRSPVYIFKVTTESDPRDKVGCCGKQAVSVAGLTPAMELLVEVPLNLAFFLLPIVLLRRKKRQ